MKNYVTYLIWSDVLNMHKIGKSTRLPKRIESLSSNVKDKNLKIIKVHQGDCEKYFHKIFKDKHIKEEWFVLTQEDVEFIINDKPITREQTFGKYYNLATNWVVRAQLARELGLHDETIYRWIKSKSPNLTIPENEIVILKYIDRER